jgi:hypothetical protein
MNAQLKETTGGGENRYIVERRNELIEKYRNTTDKDYKYRVELCLELVTLFPRRVDWQRRHGRSYGWATATGILPKAHGKGFKNGKPALFSRASDLARVAKARDELHEFCCLQRIPYGREFFAGEILKQKVAEGNSIESALDSAKQALLTGMAE